MFDNVCQVQVTSFKSDIRVIAFLLHDHYVKKNFKKWQPALRYTIVKSLRSIRNKLRFV